MSQAHPPQPDPTISLPSWAIEGPGAAKDAPRGGSCGESCGCATGPASSRESRDLDPIPFVDEASVERERARAAKRIMLAAILLFVIWVVGLLVLPEFGLVLPWYAVVGAGVAIAVGGMLNAPARVGRREARIGEDGARPIGCCPGPRPPRSLR
ncbi:MAG: hypothetical protein RBS39_12080 [Phycisphaerales bacterium]|jgi:hypothetical protein|nr:hypothetical protein [Phycisphaerales bacterium]